MFKYTMTLADGTEFVGLATGTDERDVFTYLADGQRGVRSLTVTQADDLTWPSRDECPVFA